MVSLYITKICAFVDISDDGRKKQLHSGTLPVRTAHRLDLKRGYLPLNEKMTSSIA